MMPRSEKNSQEAGAFNYIPTKKKEAYGDALMREYKAAPE